MTSLAAQWTLAAPGREPARPATLRFEDGRIAAIEPGAPDDGRIALPALSNAHDHGRAFRPAAFGAADQMLETWLPALGLAPAADLHAECVAAFGRLALSGVGAIAHVHIPRGGDPVEEARAVCRAAVEIGVRLSYVAPIVDANPFVYGGAEAICGCHRPEDWAVIRTWDGAPADAVAQTEAVDAIAEAVAHPLIDVQYGPAGPQWVTEEGWAALARRSHETGRRVHTHLLETALQREWSDAHHPEGIVTRLDRLGAVSGRLTVAHGVHLRPGEIALLAERGATVAVNTSSNLRLRSGTAPVGAFLAAGLRFAPGLDGMAFDDDEDMLREVRLLHALHAPRGLSEEGLTTADLWDALAEGARTITRAPRSGRLAPGEPADVVVLDGAALMEDAVPGAPDPLDLAMTRAARRHVRELQVAGRPVVRDGRLLGADLGAAEAALRDAARHQRGPDPALMRRHQAAVRRHYAKGGHRRG